MRKPPPGYVGHDHETLGSDILSVLQATSLPRTTLGPELLERVNQVRPDRWYPIELLLEVMDRLLERGGPSGMRRMGRELFKLSHSEGASQRLHSARDVLYGFDAMYRHANRGSQIGGWEVLTFEPGRAELRKTTPHLCYMEEGIFIEALRGIGISATVMQPECIHEGADACRFRIGSMLRDHRWTG